MPITVTCPSCSARVRLPDNAAGRRFRCPKCRGVLPGPPAPLPEPTGQARIRPDDQVEPGFVDSPPDPDENQQISEPAPISAAARKAARSGFNPFDDGSGDEEDEATPRGKRRHKPKEDYNPFAEPPAAESAADPGQVFDFGVEAPPSAPANDFDFGSTDSSEGHGPRRRRR